MNYYVRFIFLVACTTAFSSTASAAGWKWWDCGLTTDVIRIQSIESSLDYPAPGKDITVKVNFTAQEVIEDGAFVDLTVKLGLIKIIQRRFDLCEELRNINATTQCPIEKGVHTVEHIASLPRPVPKAKFALEILGFTAGDDDLFCTGITVDFMTNPNPVTLDVDSEEL